MENMTEPSKNIEDMIVPCEWTDKDTDIVVQAAIDRELGLKPTFELD